MLKWNEVRRPFREALIDAFDWDSLKIVLLYHCDERRLDRITAGIEGFDTNVDEVIADAERNGWLDKLANGALAENSTHSGLIATVPPILEWLAQPVQSCPYRGLFAFSEEDAANFFGREIYTDALTAAVEKQALIAFVGPSGSGKSSVVFAGLIPKLRRDPQWQIVDFRPGNRPFYNLATALLNLDETPTSHAEQLDEKQHLAEVLGGGEELLSLNDVILDLLQDKEEETRLLLVADQFEELYTLVPDPALRKRFLDVLLALNGAKSTVLLLTLRADFLGQALEYRPFADALQDHDIKLGPMTTDELRRAILCPAENAGVSFEPGLEERIVRDLEDESGNLPLLQFALTEMWDRQEHRQLTHAAYEEIGCVDGAVAHYANKVYEDLDEEMQIETRDVFTQLVHPGPGNEFTRRLALRTEMSADDWQVAQQLADDRLVVTDRDDDGRETVEVVHEALIQNWDKMQSWLEADRTFLTWKHRFDIAFVQWQNSEENEGALLQGLALDEAELWLAERGDNLSQAEQGFVEKSKELQKAQDHRKIVLNLLPWIIGVLLVIIVTGGLWLTRDKLLLRCYPDCSNWGPILFGVDWSEEFLPGFNLSNANLRGADLTATTLSKADLSEADLAKANLSAADLSGAILHGTTLSEANLSGANLSMVADPIGANLREANLTGADLTGADLGQADLNGAILKWARLGEADLRGADLSGANLKLAVLFKTDLRKADLCGTDLSGTKLHETDLREARYDSETRWPDDFDPEASGAEFASEPEQKP